MCLGLVKPSKQNKLDQETTFFANELTCLVEVS